MAAGTGVQTQPYAQGQGRPMAGQPVVGAFGSAQAPIPGMQQTMNSLSQVQPPSTGAPQMAPPTPMPNQGIPQPVNTAIPAVGGDVPPTGGLMGTMGGLEVPAPSTDMQAAVMPGGQAMQAQQEGGYFAGGSPYTPSAAGGRNMFEQASDATSRGMQGSARELGYTPAMIQGGGYRNANVSAHQMGAAQVGRGDINRYMNPYTQSVIDQSIKDIERNRLIQANQAGAQAQAAGAFGGSRGALMESEIARNAMEQAARTASGLRSEGFSQASQLAQQDAARRQQAGMTNVQTNLQSQLANQAAQARAQEFGLGQQMQASLANQAALLGGSQQRLNAANQLANIGNLGFGQAQSVQQGLQMTGAQQQAINQQLIDAARGQFQGYTGYPQQQLSYLAQALGASPMPQTTTTSSNPGAFGWLSMLLGSDVQFKENITPVGKTKDGHNLYMWDWNETAKEVLGETGSSMGVLAQEVMETNPELVVRGDHGYLMVNYGGIH